MDKKGRGATKWIAGILAVITFLGIFGYGVVRLTGEAGVSGIVSGDKEVTSSAQQAQAVVEALSKGTASQLSYLVYDWQASTKTSADAVPVYIRDKQSGVMIVDGTVSSTTSNTVKTKVGANLEVYAFNTSNYAEIKPYKVNGNLFNPLNFLIIDEQPQIEIHTSLIANSMDVQLYDSTLKSGENITISAGSSNSYDYLKIKNNATNRAYNLGGLYVDTPVGTNITDIEIGENLYVSDGTSGAKIASTGTKIWRAQETSNYVFEVDADGNSANGYDAILLGPGDYIKTGAYKITIDGDGCPTSGGTGERLSEIYVFDKGCYKGTQKSEIVCNKIENDATSPADVGGSDFQVLINTADNAGQFYCNS